MEVRHWDSFWKDSKSLDSFSEMSEQSDKYIFLRKFWEGSLTLVQKKEKVVDIGSGNGGIALIAQNFSDRNGLYLDVHAIDQVNLDKTTIIRNNPEYAKQLQKIHFSGSQKVENLKYSEESISLFTSQFAYEYMERGKALRAMYHALKPGGCIAIIAHSDESIITEDSRVGVASLNEALHKSPLFVLAEMYLSFKNQVVTDKPAKNSSVYSHLSALEASIKWTMDTLNKKFGDTASPWLIDVTRRVAKVLAASGKVPVNVVQKELENTFRALQDSMLRSEDQIEAALSDNDLAELRKLAEEIGFKVFECSKLTIGEELIGWSIKISK